VTGLLVGGLLLAGVVVGVVGQAAHVILTRQHSPTLWQQWRYWRSQAKHPECHLMLH